MRTLIFLTTLLLWTEIHAQIIVNELNPAPVAGEPEWVELYNTRNQTYTLRGAMIHDKSTLVSLPDIKFTAHGYALLTRDTTALREVRVLPPGVPLVEIKLPSLNNTSDIVVLLNADSTTMDSVYYSMKWGYKGISLERIDPYSPAISEDNFAPCALKDSASAGYINSVVLLDYDARALALQALPEEKIGLVIANNGRQSLPDIQGELFIDKNNNGLPEASEQLFSTSTGALQSKEQKLITTSLRGLPHGALPCIGIVHEQQDGRPQNDTVRSTLFHSYPFGTILINEIMFEPLAGNAQFVELWNNSTDTVDLSGWMLHDRASASGADTLTIGSLLFPPQSYAVLAWDSSFFQQFPPLVNKPLVYCHSSSLHLNITGDEVILRDPNRLLADSVAYEQSWHLPALSSTTGISLEKINPTLPSAQKDAWTSSGDGSGATPARVNSIAIPLPDAGALSASPNPFSPSGKNETSIISYQLPFRQAHLSLTIFDANGFPLRTVMNAGFTSAQGFVLWNGENDEGTKLPPGPYIVFLEAVDIPSGEAIHEKMLIVIAP